MSHSANFSDSLIKLKLSAEFHFIFNLSLNKVKEKAEQQDTASQDLRPSTHERWQSRVPAGNKSTLGAGSALVKLDAGMESKSSTNTCTSRERAVLAKTL